MVFAPASVMGCESFRIPCLCPLCHSGERSHGWRGIGEKAFSLGRARMSQDVWLEDRRRRGGELPWR